MASGLFKSASPMSMYWSFAMLVIANFCIPSTSRVMVVLSAA